MTNVIEVLWEFRHATPGLREVSFVELQRKGVVEVRRAIDAGLVYRRYYVNGAYLYGLTAKGVEEASIGENDDKA